MKSGVGHDRRGPLSTARSFVLDAQKAVMEELAKFRTETREEINKLDHAKDAFVLPCVHVSMRVCTCVYVSCVMSSEVMSLGS